MKLTKRIAAVVALAMASSITLVGAPAAKAATQTTLTIGALQDIKSWDPSQAHIGHFMPYYQAAYDSFLIRDIKGNPLPNLATKWVWSTDKKSLLLLLRNDVKFTNGEAFDAAAAKANLDNNRKSTGPQAPQLTEVTSVDIAGKYSIRINLSSPNPALLTYLAGSSGFVAAPSTLGTPALAAAPVGSGPYILNTSKSSKGSTYVFDANPKYWDKSKQKFDTVTFKVITDTTARLNAILSGQIDATLLDYPTTAPALAGGLTLKQSFVDWSGILLWDRDGTKVKALGDVRVRQAINMAFDRAAMLKALLGGTGAVTNQVFSPTSGAYDEALDKTYPYDPKKAKELLKAAGYANGFELPMPNITFANAAMAAFIAQYLKEIGITVKWQDVAPANFVTELRSGKYPASWFQLFQGSPWEAIQQMVTPNATWNILKSTDPDITAALDKIQKRPATLEAQAKVINQILTNKAWFVPFFRLPQQFFVGKHVDVTPQPQNAVPYLFNYSPSGK
ncbi:MAG: ABC transporter substrate-binding protein [Candidatus Nanopelagicaceae bacterium]